VVVDEATRPLDQRDVVPGELVPDHVRLTTHDLVET